MDQKRRTFIKTSAAFGLGLSFLGCSSEMAEAVMKSKYTETIGLQLWTVRNQLEKDFAGTIKKLAAQGFYQIESMDMEQAKKAAPIAKEAGLKIKSSHILSAYFTGRWDLREIDSPRNFDKLIEDAKNLEIEHLVVGYLFDQERSLDDYKKLSDAFNVEGEKCAKAGITLGYHNHNFEFDKVDGVVPYELMMKTFDPKYAQFELDVFWASVAGTDPVELMKRMKGQISLLHLKDKKKGQPNVMDTGDVPEEAYKELGNGVVDIKSIVKLAEETGVEYCFIEQDHSPDTMASTKTSIDWLKKNV